ncbi:hypothetical protein M8C21_007844 [Ambrosia artemisiifolia]|uniref:Deoxyhypusine synthase n=1 Tax=Ambrosia artemisiifolia TaxID=4212 RepID=A0AAD5CWB0_AMBAR|nr:hypothetical protein M8C21_007844 [Ambrosia artemisiifolia]
MGKVAKEAEVMEKLRSAVFKESESLEGVCAKIEGYDFNRGVSRSQIVKSLGSTGFQASHLDDAIKIVNQMLEWRLSDEDVAEDCSVEEKDLTYRESVKCKIFLGFNLNLNSAGVREYIRYLAQHRMVDVIVTTHKGIEEDIIKCLLDTYNGGYAQLDCIGKYRKLEEWIVPIFDKMLEEQNTEHVLWTPSRITARLGKEINNESSYLYWAYKGYAIYQSKFLTDDTIYIVAMNGEAVHANPRKTGMIFLGGGLPKHHICNANMMRNGADYAVIINTAKEFDGSDSGAHPDETVSWGKICPGAKSVKVQCDATIAFPLIVADTFAARRENKRNKTKFMINSY